MGQTQSEPIPKRKSAAYVPAVTDFLTDGPRKTNKKVVVVGSGCAGLGAAWHLNRAGVDVTLLEASSKLGGHANTISVDGVDVDTGFMVYNSLNYPNLCAFFEELGLEGEPTTMGFSVSMDNGSLEWCSDSLSGLLATPGNAYDPRIYTMINDILRFNTLATKVLSLPDDDPLRGMAVRDFLSEHSLSDSFRDFYLIPMTGAIWSATAEDILSFPVITLFTFLNNHLLLQVTQHINWQTPKGRSKQYVQKVAQELGSKAKVNCAVKSVTRRVVDNGNKGYEVLVVDQSDKTWVFDEVVFACHPDQALALLGSDASVEEKAFLSVFKYDDNITYLHSDPALMPKSKAAWTSWNYVGTTQDKKAFLKPVFVTYWLNKLQNLATEKPIFVSLNPFAPPDPALTHETIHYAHPQYSKETVRAQRHITTIQGQRNTYFCGAWMGYGFHEDGFRSGIEVAMKISNVPVPWMERFGVTSLIPAPKMELTASLGKPFFQQLVSLGLSPVQSVFEHFCQQQCLSFLRQGFAKGKLTLLLPNKQVIALEGTQPGQEVTVQVKKNWFFVRLALEADLGLAKSYIAGEWDVVGTGPHAHGLTSLMLLLIDNMPIGRKDVAAGWDANKLITASLGSAINFWQYRFFLDNSLANSQSNIHAHYDLSNALFETFLDRDHLMYSSALFTTSRCPTTGETLFHDSLETAQLRKIDLLLSKLEPIGPQDTLLDVGFGWGGICIRAAEKYGCRVVGITLSVEQKALAEARVQAKGLGHLISFQLVDYREFAAQCVQAGRAFDRIVSCEMIEAVGHNHLPSFFQAIESLLAPQGIFVMQAITMPDSRYANYVRSADFCNTIIFPGGCCPSLSALLQAMSTESTLFLDSAVNFNLHYAETLRRWRVRFNQALAQVLALGFDDTFIRLWNLYLCYCEAGFQRQIINLQVLTFSRPNNPNMIPTHARYHST